MIRRTANLDGGRPGSNTISNPTANLNHFKNLLRANPNRPAVLAVGDSWFSFPGSNALTGLMNLGDYNVLKKVQNGGEALAMMSGAKKVSILRAVTECPIRVVLFSGGGNDFAGRYDFPFLIRSNPGGSAPEDYMRMDRVNRLMGQIGAAYRNLLEYCLEFSMLGGGIKVVTHAYDYAYPHPRGVNLTLPFLSLTVAGPWMHPFLEEKGVPPRYRDGIVKRLIDEFAAALDSIKADYPDHFFPARTPGTLRRSEWQDELHPADEGFKKIARKIKASLDAALA